MKKAVKKTFYFFYEVLTSKPFMGAFTFIILSLVMAVAAGVVIKNGDLNVGGKLIFSKGTQVVEPNPGFFQIYNPNGDAVLSMRSSSGSAAPMAFLAGQTDHFSAIPGGGFNYHFFEQSISGENKEVRIYGYPAGASGSNYAKMQIINPQNDLLIATGGENANIILDPYGRLFVEGNVTIIGDLYVKGCIYYIKEAGFVPVGDCTTP